MNMRRENMEAVSGAMRHCEVIESLTGPQQPMNELQLQLGDVTRQHEACDKRYVTGS